MLLSETMIPVVIISTVVIGVAMAIMAVGVIFSDRCLRGSCGGPEVVGPNGESLSCATCPRRRSISTDPPPTHLRG